MSEALSKISQFSTSTSAIQHSIFAKNSKRIKMSPVNLLLDISRLREIPDMPLIELFCKDDKIKVNRTSPELVSFANDSDYTILQTRHLTILDMKKRKKTTIDSLLRLINDGKTKFNDELEEEEVFCLAETLGLKITLLESSRKKIKIEAPIVPEEEPKDEDPGLMEFLGTLFSCLEC